MVAKYIPPSSNNHREVIFYSAETAANYGKEYMTTNHIKIIEGDIGLSFYEFQLVMMKERSLYDDSQAISRHDRDEG
jgi:hypothetical protein